MRKWDNIKYVYLKKKKANGHPRHRNIGDKLEVIRVHYDEKYTFLEVVACDILENLSCVGGKNPSFKLHESYVTNISELRDKYITDILADDIEYYSDDKRHLVCIPYTTENLHLMAEDLNIKRVWFHKNHYDIPKKRIEEIQEKTTIVSSRDIVNIINGEY